MFDGCDMDLSQGDIKMWIKEPETPSVTELTLSTAIVQNVDADDANRRVYEVALADVAYTVQMGSKIWVTIGEGKINTQVSMVN